MTSWKATSARLEEDKKRLLEDFKIDPSTRPFSLWSHPSYQCVFLYRLSHYFFQRKKRLLARFFWHLNLIVTGADMSPISDIGGGLVIRKPEKIIIVGKIGKNCKLMGQGGLGGGRSVFDIGAGPGLPVVGDNVCIDFGAVVLGPIRIGNDVIVGARALVVKDVPDGVFVEISQVFQNEPRKKEINPEPLTEKKEETFWKQMEQDILQYLHYSSDFIGNNVGLLRKISTFLTPSLLCNFFYRISHVLYRKNWRRLSRFFFTINYVLHRAYIAPESRIGGGLYIPHTSGIAFCGNAGNNLVLYANATVCSQNIHVDTSRVYEDSPTLGDNVVVGAYSVVTGGIRVGSNTSIGVNAFLCESVGDNSIILSRERVKMEKADANDYEEARQN